MNILTGMALKQMAPFSKFFRKSRCCKCVHMGKRASGDVTNRLADSESFSRCARWQSSRGRERNRLPLRESNWRSWRQPNSAGNSLNSLKSAKRIRSLQKQNKQAQQDYIGLFCLNDSIVCQFLHSS